MGQHDCALTTEGTILGTPQNMSREQIEGREADARTDIFAFGCVFYEMVTGKRAFDGKTKASVIGAILATDPAMAAVQPKTPAALDKLVRRCLAKDPEERWQSMRDLVLELRSIDTDANVAVSVRTRRSWLAATVAAASTAALAIVLLYWWQPRASELRTVQFLVHPPEGMEFFHEFAGTAVSPDGKHLVFSAGSTSASAFLWVRPTDSTNARPLMGSQGGNLPFWATRREVDGIICRREVEAQRRYRSTGRGAMRSTTGFFTRWYVGLGQSDLVCNQRRIIPNITHRRSATEDCGTGRNPKGVGVWLPAIPARRQSISVFHRQSGREHKGYLCCIFDAVQTRVHARNAVRSIARLNG